MNSTSAVPEWPLGLRRLRSSSCETGRRRGRRRGAHPPDSLHHIEVIKLEIGSGPSLKRNERTYQTEDADVFVVAQVERREAEEEQERHQDLK